VKVVQRKLDWRAGEPEDSRPPPPSYTTMRRLLLELLLLVALYALIGGPMVLTLSYTGHCFATQ
jgi:hypothetical protein